VARVAPHADVASCELHLYGELNDFVGVEDRHRAVVRGVYPGQTVKDVVEAAGVPHPEVALVRLDGEAVGWGARVGPGSRVDVHPPAVGAEPAAGTLLPPPRPCERFVLDGHLGRLARTLRLLGLDTAYANDADDVDLARCAAVEDRVLLTRDVALLKRSMVQRGRWVRATDPRRQVIEVLRRYPPAARPVPFSRCLRCNGQLVPADKASVASVVPPLSFAAFDVFWRCSTCGHVYWPGGHHDRLAALVSEVERELGWTA
jgi:uncharacterized protein with PIN domain